MSHRKIKRLLIANRGEIAVRIIRAARDLGIESVVVYADPDQSGMAVRLADFAVRLPGTTPADTYLNIPKIIAAVKASGADAVHPGYGFISENADFAEAVAQAGAVFVGPPVKAMRLMGDKIEAKALMIANNVPVVPGADHPLKSVEELQTYAKKIGYPMILKAAAGGGGRGMRVVRHDADLAEAFAACSREALSYFGNAAVFCERYIDDPRHIEFQVLFDGHGNGVHLFERDCSIQRRHQKLIEEAPSSYLTPALRDKLGEFAVRAAAAAGYAGAGTVEFICESPEKAYFMEMNTRIQVEHPVTEEITGVDLIAMQLRIAGGEKLPFSQKDLKIRGWAFEARINAEDPAQEFAPSPGCVSTIIMPAGPGVRVDTHLYPGYTIPQQYDSMVAKLIVWGETREVASARLQRALGEIRISGVPTTAKFHEAILTHPDFKRGTFTTRFIEDQAEWFKKTYSSQVSGLDEKAAILSALLFAQSRSTGVATSGSHTSSPASHAATSASQWKNVGRSEATGVPCNFK